MWSAPTAGVQVQTLNWAAIAWISSHLRSGSSPKGGPYSTSTWLPFSIINTPTLMQPVGGTVGQSFGCCIVIITVIWLKWQWHILKLGQENNLWWLDANYTLIQCDAASCYMCRCISAVLQLLSDLPGKFGWTWNYFTGIFLHWSLATVCWIKTSNYWWFLTEK